MRDGRRRSFRGGDSGLRDGRLQDIAGRRSSVEKWEKRRWGRRRGIERRRRQYGDKLVGRTSDRHGRRRHLHHGWLQSAAVLFVRA